MKPRYKLMAWWLGTNFSATHVVDTDNVSVPLCGEAVPVMAGLSVSKIKSPDEIGCDKCRAAYLAATEEKMIPFAYDPEVDKPEEADDLPFDIGETDRPPNVPYSWWGDY